jgi:RHS repeat-associated protein
MLGREVHTNFCAVLVWEMQEPQKKTASVKKCSDYYPFGKVMQANNNANPNDNYKFTGHERDDEASLSIDYMNARTYDPVIGKFMQIDPLHMERPGLSPFNYVQNNPLLRVDPSGMLDDYALDKNTGEITLIRETDDDFDVLYATDEKGNIDESKSITVSKDDDGGSVLSDLSSGEKTVDTEYDGKTYTGVVANTTNGSDAKRVFGFAAKNSNVEWSYQEFTDGTFSLSTAFNSNITTTGSMHSSNSNKLVAHDVHNHPVDIDSDRYPSGGDEIRASVLAKKNPNVKVWLYVPQNRSSNRLWDVRSKKRIN